MFRTLVVALFGIASFGSGVEIPIVFVIAFQAFRACITDVAVEGAVIASVSIRVGYMSTGTVGQAPCFMHKSPRSATGTVVD